MPWLSLKIVPPAKIARQGLERLRKGIPSVGRLRLYKAAIEIRKRMKVEGKPVTYPINWDTEKQRKAFFATDAFTIKGRRPLGYVNEHIPTVRTGDYQKAWQVIRTEDGYDVGNPLAHSQYIGGTARSADRQSRIHRGRWPVFKRQIEIVLRTLPKLVKDNLKAIARQAGFRPND